MKSCPTFTADIYVGRLPGYSGPLISPTAIFDVLHDYVDTESYCVSVSETTFIYKGGGEPGYVVRLINYPRFPDTATGIRERALEIARRLRRVAKQTRVSVVFQDETVMLGSE